MNKKIFAALASATMALSATGSLAVFAEDFDVVTEDAGNNGAGSGTTVADGKVALTTENFPDAELINSIITSLDLALKYGDTVTVKDVTDLILNDKVKDLAGIEKFTSLKTVKGANVSALKTADLSECDKLTTINFHNAKSLATLILPAGRNLTYVEVLGGDKGYDAPITELDFSGNKNLANVVVENTDIAKVDLSNNKYLVTAKLGNNDLNTIDVTGCASLETLEVQNNDLYGIELPVNNVLVTLDVTNNLLQELDVTMAHGLTTLKASNNELRTLDLSETPDLNTLQLFGNHLGALDLDGAIDYITQWADSSNAAVDLPDTDLSDVNGQVLYVNPEFNAVNLSETFEDFDADKVGVADAEMFNKKTGVLTLDGDQTWYTYNKASVCVIKADVLNRLYNPNSGEHFYTKDLNEKDTLVKLGWHDEGQGWVSPKESSKPVYRLYNPNAGDHHYTMNAYERDTLASVGWKYEGIGWYSYAESTTYNDRVVSDNYAMTYTIKPVPVLREYNPNAKAAGAHNYTINPAENDFLVSVGWIDEGIGWFSMN